MSVVKTRIARAFSPGSVGNIGVGFDIIGHSIAGIGDIATVRRIDEPTVRISAIRGTVTDLPLEAARNTAGAALIALRDALALPFGFEIEIDKGIPLGSGLGGSAASCVAALVAANALLDAERDAFMDGLAALDVPMQAALDAARARGCVLRYVARLEADGSAKVALQELPNEHAFAHLRLTDNCVQFTTRRYCDNPLIVQGPGAGPEVTAAGVFSDLLRVAASLGARL